MGGIEVRDSRRLTGPNLLQAGAGPTADVFVDDEQVVPDLVAAWETEVARLLALVDETPTTTAHRVFGGGVSLAFTGPIDRLYALCELNEAAIEVAVSVAMGAEPPEPDVDHLRAELAAETELCWLDLQHTAAAADVPFLWDDDEFSWGYGRHGAVWPVDALPDPTELDPDEYAAIPVAVVTGTNGKSTTVRLLSSMLEAAGRSAGHTSTDGIRVAGELVESGDWSGPGGARTLLRRPDVEVAVLEVARGGLLRRGMPLDRADVAVVTNVADDHLGEYGIETVADLAHAKLVVSRVIDDAGLLILNADDEHLVAAAPAEVPIGWFTLDPANTFVAAHVAADGVAWTVLDGVVVERRGDVTTPIVRVDQAPITLGGAAQHNVANLLAACAAARRLDTPRDAIVEGARAFRGDADDNPGRANRFDLDGIQILVDFAHNPAGMGAILSTASALPAERRLVMFAQAGDRSDRAIRALAGAVVDTDPDRVIAADVPSYLRGRDPMEVPALMMDELAARGFTGDIVTTATSPLDGAQQALDWARTGDLVVLLTLEQRDDVLTLLHDRGATAM